MKRSFRHFANGIVWDPRGKYIVTLSTDRRMDVLEAQKGTLLRSCHQIELPMTKLTPSGNTIIQQVLKAYYFSLNDNRSFENNFILKFEKIRQKIKYMARINFFSELQTLP
jgi:hypothetical protein